ncbi:WAT1-related protein At5g07050 [Linum perenne]
MKKTRVKEWLSSFQVMGSMVLVQGFATGMVLLSKVILNGGTFVFALLAYRHVIAALCIAPFALFLERSPEIKIKLCSWSVWFWLFINAITGITLALGLYYYGLRDTTASYAVNFFNLVPILTFAFSILLRMEKLGLDTTAGRMKSIGAIVCVAGAVIACLYKGKTFYLLRNHHHDHHHQITSSYSNHRQWVSGTLMLIGGSVSYSTWYILQVKVQKVFPFRYWATMLTCAIAAVQSSAVGLCIDRRKSAWELGWNMQLLTIVYSGAFSSAATFCLIFWVVSKRGPTYPPMFNPLSLVFVTLLDSMLLDQQLSIGALLGMVAILVGLYSFLLGKNKEMKMNNLRTQDPVVDDDDANEASLQSDPELAVTPSRPNRT